MARKFIYYLRGFSRTIVITDNDDNVQLDQLVARTSQAMSGTEISKFETDNDILIARPSDIVAVHIMKELSDSNGPSTIDELDTGKEMQLRSIVPEIDLGELEVSEETEIIDTTDIECEDVEEQENNPENGKHDTDVKNDIEPS